MNHLSASQLGMYMRCPMQWEWRYQKGIKTRPGVSLVVGSGTHTGIEYNLKHFLEKGVQAKYSDVQDVTAQDVRDRCDNEDVEFQIDESRGDAVDSAVALSSLHYTDVAPSLYSGLTHVERSFSLELGGFPYSLDGFIDVQCGNKIRDTKTAGKAKRQDEADKSVQLTLYGLAALTIDKELDDVELYFDVLVKTKVPKAQILMTRRDEEDYRRLIRLCEIVAHSIENQVFMPAQPDSWVCSERFCGYWKLCDFGSKNKKAVAV